MKKIFGLLFILFVVIIFFVLYLYSKYLGISNLNDHLTPINYVVQIFYNVGYFIIACAVLFIADNQLNKTREATTIQALTNISNNLNSDDYFKKRKALAAFILAEGKDSGGNYIVAEKLKEYTETTDLNASQKEELAKIKNKFEVVLYDFEILSYYHEKSIFSIEDIYELFSYEIQHYWVLVYQLGYINYLRKNRLNGHVDYYNQFHHIFRLSIKCEAKKAIKFKNKFYKKANRVLFYKQAREILKMRNDSIDIFLLEEANLI